MTDDSDGKKRQTARFEHNGVLFEIDDAPVSKSRRQTGRFAAVIERDGGGYTGWITADFDTEDEAVAAGKALIVAKTAEYQTLRGKFKGILESIAAWICLVPLAIFMVIFLVMNAIDKRWHRRA